jgi:hypothetical protein
VNLDDFIIWLYVRIEEICREMPAFSCLRQRGPDPALSDLEVLTIEMLGSYQGLSDDAAIWRYIRDHWHNWFPALGSYKNFAKHCANLLWLKQAVHERLIAAPRQTWIVDGLPLPVCHKARGNRCRSFRGEAAWGYCAAKDEHYYGFRAVMAMTSEGRIGAVVLTAANIDERAALDDLPDAIKGLMIGDKGFLSADRKADMAARGIDLQTPVRNNMPDNRPKEFINWMMNTRRLIETAFAKLTAQFSINRIKARNIWHMTNKIIRKIIAYNLAIDFHGSMQFLKT